MISLISICFAIGIMLHMAFGHSAVYIATDLARGIIILVGGTVGTSCLLLANRIIKTPAPIWERNRKAAKLAQKVNGRKTLSESEQKQLCAFLDQHILTALPYSHTGNWHMHVTLSKEAIQDVLRC